MLRRTLSLTSLTLLAALLGGTGWLLGSASGLKSLAALAGPLSRGQLQIEQASGRLLGPLQIGQLRWQSPELTLQAEQIELDWTPAALLHGTLAVAELRIDRLRIDLAPSDTPTPPPTDLHLPFKLALAQLRLGQLLLGDSTLARNLSGRLDSDGEQFRLDDFAADSGETHLAASATLSASAPLDLAASGEITGRLADKPLALSLHAAGPLAGFRLQATASAGLQGEATLHLTPFAAAPFSSAQVALDQIDPAAWQAGAPSARLKLQADIQAQGTAEHIAGHFVLSNPLAGPLDRQRLPLARLEGRLDWQGESARFDDLKASLPGGGEVRGQGRWQKHQLELDLQASRLDAAQLLSSLRPTRLNGPLQASLGAERQALTVDLQDAAFHLQAEASLADNRLLVPKLDLAAGPARLTASGELRLDGERPFKAGGELRQFDPSRFAKLPAALINASLSAEGRLVPHPVVKAAFALKDSRLAGQPLTGEGRLDIDWPRIPQADIRLAAGSNRLSASGAFGRVGDLLHIEIEAPQLQPYGLDGSVDGRLDLAGTLQQPRLAARLHSPRLGWPGHFRLGELNLQAELGGEASSPLHLDLKLDNLDLPDQPGLLKALRLQGEGSNQAHRLGASARLAGKDSVRLGLAGGLVDLAGQPGWRGQIVEARFNEPEQPRSARLDAPAELQFAASGWRLGPARLSGSPNNWQAGLQAETDGKQLHASLNARGPRIGQIDGRLDAGMDGAWSLNQQAAWQGSLKSDITDLGWLAELIGDAWQSEGRFNGELKIAGTPAQPVANGQFRGEKLALRLPEQGLNLARGELDIELRDNLLRVRQLRFDSLLQALPRPLRLSDTAALATLSERPGRLEVSGEMQIDRNRGADNAFLDFHLDRLGAFQLPDQWVAVSGDGRVSWRGDTFGARGKLTVDAGYWQLAPGGAPRLSDDVIVTRPDQEKPAAGLRPKLDLDISTDLGRNFLFKGAGLTTRLSGDIRLRASGRDLPRASGIIRTRDGRFEAYGQQLAIERGVLTFQGLLDNPALDVRAVRKGLAVEPGVQISGSAQRPVIKLVSDPELPEAEKLAWLVLGHGPEQMGAGDASVLLSAAGGLLGNNSGGVVQQLKKSFGLDEFGVRTGQLGDTGSRLQSSRVAGGSVDTSSATGAQILSVGKRLSSNALLSYEQALGKAESIVKLTVNLTRQVSLIGRAGSDNALDIFYTLSFGRESRPEGVKRPAAAPAPSEQR
jgi:translocation and assembly module TamB